MAGSQSQARSAKWATPRRRILGSSSVTTHSVACGGPSVRVARQAEKKAGNQVERVAAERAEHAQELGFGALIQTATGLHLHGGGAVARHGFEVSARPEFAGAGRWRCAGRGRPRPQSCGVDAGRRKGQVGVASRRSRA